MFMRYRGGGIGHVQHREATNVFLQDRTPLEKERVKEELERTQNRDVSQSTSPRSADPDDDDEVPVVSDTDQSGPESGNSTSSGSDDSDWEDVNDAWWDVEDGENEPEDTNFYDPIDI